MNARMPEFISLVLRPDLWAMIGKGLRRRLYSDSMFLGLRRDLTVPFEAPPASVSLTVRPLRPGDEKALLDPNAPSLSSEAIHERLIRLRLLQASIPTCYVAVTSDDSPCYMQWLVGAKENGRLQDYFRGRFPQLAPDQALLEGAFTPEPHRGKRIMPCAMAQIAERAADLGARWVITFVGEHNIPSLKGCKRAGFLPFLVRNERWRLFRLRLHFEPLPAGTPYPFDREPEPSMGGRSDTWIQREGGRSILRRK
jgi:hypothetical protein